MCVVQKRYYGLRSIGRHYGWNGHFGRRRRLENEVEWTITLRQYSGENHNRPLGSVLVPYLKGSGTRGTEDLSRCGGPLIDIFKQDLLT